MQVSHEQRENGKAPDRTFVVAGDGTVTVKTGSRRGFYLATATIDVAFCLRAPNRDDAEQEVEGWLDHLLNVATGDVLIRSVSGDVDASPRCRGPTPRSSSVWTSRCSIRRSCGAASAARRVTAVAGYAERAGSNGCASATRARPRGGTASPTAAAAAGGQQEGVRL